MSGQAPVERSPLEHERWRDGCFGRLMVVLMGAEKKWVQLMLWPEEIT